MHKFQQNVQPTFWDKKESQFQSQVASTENVLLQVLAVVDWWTNETTVMIKSI